MDVGEEVALLPETHGQVEHRDIEKEREERVQVPEQKICKGASQRQRYDDQDPGNSTVAVMSIVETLDHRRRNLAQRPNDEPVDRQGLDLLHEQRDYQSKKGHAITWVKRQRAGEHNITFATSVLR